jgi:hypothetical protein
VCNPKELASLRSIAQERLAGITAHEEPLVSLELLQVRYLVSFIV